MKKKETVVMKKKTVTKLALSQKKNPGSIRSCKIEEKSVIKKSQSDTTSGRRIVIDVDESGDAGKSTKKINKGKRIIVGIKSVAVARTNRVKPLSRRRRSMRSRSSSQDAAFVHLMEKFVAALRIRVTSMDLPNTSFGEEFGR
jgi:hypothetical protein